MKTAIQLIAAERERQITSEGWTQEHDDAHNTAQLARAARCYLGHGLGLIYGFNRQSRTPQEWPWEAEWWKPSTDPIRDLVKAAALIAAEIDRLSRMNAPEQSLEPSTVRDIILIVDLKCPECNAHFGTHYSPTDPPERSWEDVTCRECKAVWNYSDELQKTLDNSPTADTQPQPQV